MSRLFSQALEHTRDFKVHFEVDQNAMPRFYKARTLPYSKRKGVEEELARLMKKAH